MVVLMAASVLLAPQPLRVTKIRFYPAPGAASTMRGGRFTGSNSGPTTDFETLASLEVEPKEGVWNEIELPRRPIFRYLKYEGTWNTQGKIAEIEFWAGDRKLSGTAFSTVPGSGSSAALAFDGTIDTSFVGGEANGQYVGLDLGSESQVQAPRLSVPGGTYADPVEVTLTTPTPGATVRVAFGGASPQEDWGDVVKGPLRIGASTVLVARAFHPDLAASVPVVAPYRIGKAGDGKLVRTFHIGNSLTDTVVPWMEPISTAAGKTLKFHRFTIPGAPTDWLWEHPGSGFGDSRYLEAFQAFAPITHLVTQPFAGHNRSIENEADYSGRFYAAARRWSPEVQPWLYVQWPTAKLDDAWSKGEGAVAGLDGIHRPAKTYAEAVAHYMRYARTVRDRLNAKPEGKKVKIIPGGVALALAKGEIEAGKIPGLTDFFRDLYSDDLHLNGKGAFLISLVHYASFFGESPEGKVGSLNSGLTEAQAKAFARIAWRAVQGSK